MSKAYFAGIPDLNTRQLLHRLWVDLSLPTFILVDGDPFGFEVTELSSEDDTVIVITKPVVRTQF